MTIQKCPGCDTPIPPGKNKCPMCGATMDKILQDLAALEPTTTPPKVEAAQTPPQPQTKPAYTHKTCKYCSMAVPIKANFCPYCNKRITTSLGTKVVAGFIGMMVVGMIISSIKKSNEPPPTPAEAAQKKISDKNIERALAAAITIKQGLGNPGYFKLSKATIMDNGSACLQAGPNNKAVLVGQTDDIVMPSNKIFHNTWTNECFGKTGMDATDYINMYVN